jgi:glycosyltransferase involved in cell wall biosynthesis
MKVLIITAAFPPTRAGEADQALHLSRHLADRGLDVHVLTTIGSVATPSFPFKVYPIMRDWSWKDLGRLARSLRSCNADAVLLMYIGWIYHSHPMITFAATISKRLLPRARFVTQFANVTGAVMQQGSFLSRLVAHGMKLWVGAKGANQEYGTLLRDSDSVIVLSEHHKAELLRIYPSLDGRTVLIPPPPIMTMCAEDQRSGRQHGREVLGITPDEFLLVYLGYVYSGKGIETLLEAFQLLSRRRGNVRLVLVGGVIAREDSDHPSYSEHLLALAKQLGIGDRIIWTGGYSWESHEASLYLRAADAFVLPIDIGVQLNNSSFAAAATHGLPIVATRGYLLEYPFSHRENVLLCPPRNPELMAAAVEALLDKPSLREELRLAALGLAKEWFSWEKAIDRTIETLLGNERSREHGSSKCTVFVEGFDRKSAEDPRSYRKRLSFLRVSPLASPGAHKLASPIT